MRTVLLLLAFTTCALPCLAQAGASAGPPPPPPPAPEYNPKSWKEFRSEEGRFSVLLPGTPVKRVEKDGQGEMHTYALRTFAEYGVMYLDFPRPITDPAHIKAVLDGGRDEGLAGVKGRLLEEEDISLGGYAGRYHKVLTGGGHTIRSRMYVVGNRVYVLSIIMRDEGAPPAILKFHDETAAKFLDSFELIPAGQSAGDAGAGSPVPRDPKGQPPAEAQAEGEVDRQLKQLRERNELVVTSCGDSRGCQPLETGQVVNGQVVDGRLTGGKIISRQVPEYPSKAQLARAQGAVVVRVIVDGEGKVLAAQAVSGHPLLLASAVKAVRRWRFSPPLLDSKPVKVTGTVTVNFTLQ